MTESTYRAHIERAMKELNVSYWPHSDIALGREIASRLPVRVLKCVVEGQIFEDSSTIRNNHKAGQPVDFYPYWVNICREMIPTRELEAAIMRHES